MLTAACTLPTYPVKAAGDCRIKRVTTGAAESETIKPPFPNLHGSQSSLLASINPTNRNVNKPNGR
jgi:hypothetical protein